MNRRDVFKEIEDMGYIHTISYTNAINSFIKDEFKLAYFRPDSDEGDHIIAIETKERFTKWSESRRRVSFTSLNHVKEIIREAERELLKNANTTEKG